MIEPDGLIFWDENNDPAFTTFLGQKERDYPYPVEKEAVFTSETIQEAIEKKKHGLMGDSWTKEAVDKLLEELVEEFKQKDDEVDNQ